MILLGLGSNRAGDWGTPAETLDRVGRELAAAGCPVTHRSPLYVTAALGPEPQDAFVNGVLAISSSLPPEALLRRLKGLERCAGRRSGRRWGPRALDIDILDYRGLVRGWSASSPVRDRMRPPPLVLPHPQLHVRPFVLLPLLDVAPRWRHPVLKQSAQQLWNRVRQQSEGRVLKRLETAR
ncbi:MAG: 2-amino-4-hydroxy-6-hydroxymethyldihydropteridine diphosphokinase [Hyphomicrobiales bacterium]|nr:2-amino-4-hydroxy-6-hydroxymethyldihydropteridine diphosphokinase [Hyphomicrobiales bacterium]